MVNFLWSYFTARFRLDQSRSSTGSPEFCWIQTSVAPPLNCTVPNWITFTNEPILYRIWQPIHSRSAKYRIIVGTMDRESSQQLQIGFSEHFSCQNLLRRLSRLLFVLQWNKYGAEKCLKTTFRSTFEMIQLQSIREQEKQYKSLWSSFHGTNK